MGEEAENAVRCFERWSRTHVVFYHNDVRLTAMFPVNRYIHRENVCLSIKAGGYERACQHFDSKQLLANAWKFRDGGVKLCPGGVWEWIHAVYWQDNLMGILLAGGRRANLKLARKYPLYKSPGPPWQLPPDCTAENLPPVDEENGEDELVMEGLRQLAARLQNLCSQQCQKEFGENRLSSAERLRLIIERRYRYKGFNVEELAQHYHLSTSRMYHLIKEETGKSLKELVNEIRLAEACKLLENSSFQIGQIADYCGFSTHAYFFRVFRSRFGMTPQAYREIFLHDKSRLAGLEKTGEIADSRN